MLKSLRARSLRKKLGPPVIVVSGLPRSGTSMMMNMLRAADLDLVTDKVRTADEDNPKGYFEDERVKELDKTDDRTWVLDCKGKVVKIISFLLKDLPDDCFYKVIFMRRNLEEVILSQNKMLVRRGEPVNEAEGPKMIKIYETHLRKIDLLIEEKPNFDRIDVPYREVLDSPRDYAARIAGFLGLSLDLDKMAGAVDRTLYRNRRS